MRSAIALQTLFLSAHLHSQSLWKAESIEGFTIQSRQTGLSTKGYTQTGGAPLRGAENSLNEIVLKKN